MLLDIPEVILLLDELRSEFDSTDLNKLYPIWKPLKELAKL